MPIKVNVIVSLAPRCLREISLEIADGSTAQQALQLSGLMELLTAPQLQCLELSIWGRTATFSQVLRENDRLELIRPLLVDPKVARRERFAHQGAKKAGLFKTRRVGGKAGY